MKDRESTGLLLSMAGMVTYGLVPVFSHHFSMTMDPLLFAGVGTWVGSLPFLVQLTVRGSLGELLIPAYRVPFAAIGFFGIVSTLLLFIGTSLTSGLNTGLLLQVEPFYSVLIAAAFLGERTTLAEAAATLLMILGAAGIVYRGGEGLNVGDFLILLAPLFQQASHVFTKRIISKLPVVGIIPAVRFFWTGVGVTAIAVARNPAVLEQLASPKAWVGILLFGLVLRALDAWFWYAAIARISLAKASAVIPLSVAVSFLGSILFLRETVERRQVLGLTLIFGGLLWFSWLHWRRVDTEQAHEPA
ncbi:MAG: DMT family transporter [Elusimicrobia bacterium]|nr:DMT family transporter [Elusimicrobiota bacterium]